MKRLLARLLSLLLIFSLAQPMVPPAGANQTSAKVPVGEDFFVDTDAYEHGTPDGVGNLNAIFVGYADSFGAANAALKFQLGSGQVDFNRKIQSAYLRLFLTQVDAFQGKPFLDLYAAQNDSWTERDAVLPQTAELIERITESGLRQNDWVSFDVTDFLREQSADKVASFVLKGHQLPPAGGAPRIQVAFLDKSSGQTEKIPYLEITYAPNSPPTAISLSNDSVPENLPADTPVGTFNATDPDSEDQGKLTFELTGNEQGAFKLVGNELFTTASFDYETKSSYSIDVKVSDSAGNTLTKAFTIRVEDVQEPPTFAELTINEGMFYTSFNQVSLKTTVTDPDLGKPLQVRFSNAADQWTDDWKAYSPSSSYPWTLAAGDGVKTVYMQARDEAGHQISASATITLDTTPPLVTGVVDRGDYKEPVTITFNEGTAVLNGAAIVSGYKVTADGNYTLRVTDMAGNTTTLSFFLDTTAPTGSLQIESGQSFTTKRNVVLTITGTDGEGIGQLQMNFSNDGATWSGWEWLAATKAWELSPGDGSKTVKMKLKDGLGHEREYEDSITLDTTPPEAALSIKGTNAANTATSSATVKLLIEATDAQGPVEMTLSNTDGVFAGGWQPVQPELQWKLSSGDGNKTVYAKFRDAAGHEVTRSASILLDTVPPEVTGVAAGNYYNQEVTVHFSEGTAVLNGEPFADGEQISEDGTYTLVVTDVAGNTTTVSFTVDRTKPAGTFTINNGEDWTNTPQVVLQLNVTDMSPMTAAFANDAEGWQPSEPFAATKSWTLSSGDGQKRVAVKLRDAAGNEATWEAHITLDQTAPTGSFTINDDQSVTNERQVELKLQYADADDQLQMRFSPTGTNDWSDWEPAQQTKAWELSTGDGTKTVFLQLRDRAGNVRDLQKSIMLDTTPPVVSGVTHEGVYNSDQQISFSDGTATLNDAPFLSGTTVTEHGQYTLVVTDAAGNKTTIFFTIDKTPLTGTLAINQGAAFTTSRNVTLDLYANKGAPDTRMSFSNDGSTWSPAEPFALTKEWTLSEADGGKTVYVRLEDKAGYTTDVSDTIVLDTTMPAGSLLINGGNLVTETRTVNLTVTAADANGPVQARFANEDEEWNAWSDVVSALPWELSANDGSKIVRMQLRDQAGNVSSFTSSIELDMNAPVVHGVENGKSYREDVQITFNEGTATLDGQSFTSGTTVSDEGEHELVVTDAASNFTQIAFTIDKTPPQGTFAINNGAATASSVNVTLNVTATDSLGEVEMRFANENEGWSDWEQAAPTVPWRLPSGNGMKKVLLQLRDEAHNTIELEAQIRLSVYVPTPPTTVKVTGVQLDASSLQLQAGDTRTVTAVIQPENASDKRVRWASSHSAVAEVDSQGNIVARAAGTARITVTTVDGGYTDTVEVTVKEEADSSSLQASKKAFRLKPKERAHVQIFKVEGDEKTEITTDKKVEYRTKRGLVTVAAGQITAGSDEGEDVITVTYEGQELQIPVTITTRTSDKVSLLSRTEGVLAVDEERQLELVALYGDDTTEDVTDQVEWTSSNPDVVEVDEDGRMVAKATGTAVISGSIDKRKFRVRLLVVEEKHPRRIEVAPAYVRLKEGQEKALVLTGTYEKGYQDLIAEDAEWTVEDPEIAEVIDGNIVARKAGKTIVTINYKGKTASVRVEVRK
ncbi:Ig-like domain-containing surface protein [Brevibacillus sp. NSP2.1]|uniref:Ig-like domain-containing protein n=1 Tax=Brevibacillus sp. NSP2.1 TaxID=3003229 RepID=UPI000422A9C7|nr:Ig-like domain-containing protein [Brevibacillus sp. NSP2.1]QHZ55577.1 Ig-like domain-containing surface protein [Brevibacillus sp. NSP2.1]